MSYYIGGEGPKTAKLAVVAEKPGRSELEKLIETGVGRPLIGPTGRMVDNHLLRGGSRREDCYLTNAVKHFDTLGNPTNQQIVDGQLELYRELTSLPNLNCIIAMGQAALLSLSNFHLSGMEDNRGSIWPTAFGTKMVVTYHPSFYTHGEWRLKPIVDFDVQRAVQQAAFPEICRPQRTWYIEPTFQDALDWMGSLQGAKTISFDIETFYPHFISCIAFAVSPSEAYCIPIMKGNRRPYFDDPWQEGEIWRAIQRVLDQPRTQYVTQNGLFDCWHLWRHGILTPHMARGFDTMYAHRLLAADLPHSLQFLASIYTEEPYYKDESGNWRSEIRVPDPQFWGYNCKDALVTEEVHQGLAEDLREVDQYDYFMTREQARWDALMKMRQKGLRVDPLALAEVRTIMLEEQKREEKKLLDEIGYIPNTKSYLQMGQLMDSLQVRYKRTKTGRPSTKEEDMMDYALHAPNPKAQRVLMGCLEVTKRRTTVSGFLGMALDENSYYHPLIDMTKARTGRDASEGADEGGPQIQNIPNPIRHIFIPDNPESEVTNIDLEQAEGRFIAYDADDELTIEAFKKGKDVHRVLACTIFRDWRIRALPPDDLLASIRTNCDECRGRSIDKCNHSERYDAKQGRYAFCYLLGVDHYLRTQIKRGRLLSREFAERMKEAVVSPPIKAWQLRTEAELGRSPVIVNPYGRRREFYGLLDKKLLRDALAHKASSFISDIVKRATLIVDKGLPSGSRILTQTHDSLTLSSLIRDREQVTKLAEEAFYYPASIHGRELVIPIEITHGPNWRDQK